jgi:ribosomal protein S18 acetylase RimI-like enzyme
MSISIIQAETQEQVKDAKALFLEYAKSLNFDLCFQDFDKELASLPGDYTPPEGRLLIAMQNNQVAGCVALRKFEDNICEMKRLYVKPEFRGMKIGKLLAERILEEAKSIGYKKMYLDTVPSMKEAIQLYKNLGFNEINPYRYNPQPGAIFMELSW